MHKKRLLSFAVMLLLTLSLQAQINPIDVETATRPNHSVEFYYSKNLPGTYTVEVRFLLLQNAKYETEYIVVTKDKGKLLTLFPTDIDYQITYNIAYQFAEGWINPPVNRSFPYVLPFADGTEVSHVEVPFPGENIFGNQEPQKWKKYRFNTNAQFVYACRKGVVVSVDQQHTTDATTTGINTITIEHADGSRAVYEGFAQNAIMYKPGAIVHPGALLGTLPQNGYLTLRIYYLSDKHLTDSVMKTITNVGRMQVCINPLFITAEGIQFLNTGELYHTKITEQHIMEEMNAKEKRQYRKMR